MLILKKTFFNEIIMSLDRYYTKMAEIRTVFGAFGISLALLYTYTC